MVSNRIGKLGGEAMIAASVSSSRSMTFREKFQVVTLAFTSSHGHSTPNVHFIYDHKRFSAELPGRIEVTGPVGAADLHARIFNLATLGRRSGHGADMIKRTPGFPFSARRWRWLRELLTVLERYVE